MLRSSLASPPAISAAMPPAPRGRTVAGRFLRPGAVRRGATGGRPGRTVPAAGETTGAEAAPSGPRRRTAVTRLTDAAHSLERTGGVVSGHGRTLPAEPPTRSPGSSVAER